MHRHPDFWLGRPRRFFIFITLACLLKTPLFAQSPPECDSIKVEAFSLRDNKTGLIVLATDSPGKDTIVDSLEAAIPAGKAGLYDIFGTISYNSGNEQINETFYLIVVNPDGRRSYSLFANITRDEVGKVDVNGDSISYNIILDDGLPDSHVNERNAGVFFLSEGRNIIELHHYNDIALEFPRFVNCPDSATSGRNCIMGDPDIIQGPQSVRVSIFTLVEMCADLKLTQAAFTSTTAIVNGDTALAEFEDQQYEYLLTIKNNGPATARGFTVTDTIPLLLTPDFGARPPDDSFDDGLNRIVTWNFENADSLPLGAVDSIRFTVDIPASVSPLPFPLFSAARATIARDPVLENDYDSITVFVIDSSQAIFDDFDLGVIYTANKDTVISGESYIYTLTLTNFGPGDAQAFSLTDTLPSEVTLTGNVPDFDEQATVTTADNIIVWQFNNLPRDNSISASFEVVAGEVQSITDLFSVSLVEAEGDASLENNQAGVTVVALPNPVASVNLDLAHTQTASRDSVLARETFLYILTIENNGPATAFDFALRDTLPDDVTINGNLPDFGGKAQVSQSGNVVSWQIDSLTAGGALIDSFEVQIGEIESVTDLINSSVIEAANDTTADNNFAQTLVVALPNPAPSVNLDLAHSQTASRDSVLARETFLYILTIENNGPATAFDVALRDTLPGELTVVGIQPDFDGRAQISQSGNLISWRIDSLAAGEILSDSFLVHTVGEIQAVIDLINFSIVEAANDTVPENNAAQTLVKVFPRETDDPKKYTLTHSQIAEADTVKTGDTFNYALIVENLGPDSSLAFTMIDTLPALLEPSGVIPGLDSREGKILRWRFDPLAPDELLEVVFPVTVAEIPLASLFPLRNKSVVFDGDTTLFAETLVWGVGPVEATGLPIDCYLDRNVFVPEAEHVLGINFDLDRTTRVRIDIHDMAGVHIVRLTEGIFEPGQNRYEWDGIDKRGVPAGSGVYIITFRADGFMDWKKVMVVR